MRTPGCGPAWPRGPRRTMPLSRPSAMNLPTTGGSVDRTQRVAVLTAAITGRDQPAPERAGALMAARRTSADTYRVTPGDTLWAIARRTPR